VQNASERAPRPWIGVMFRCCGVYARIHKTKAGDAYAGRCPKCGSPVRAKVGEGGTDRRFFEAN